MIIKVAILNGEIAHYYTDALDKTVIDDATIEEREVEFVEGFGWRAVDYVAEPSDKERIAELEQIINMILMGDM